MVLIEGNKDYGASPGSVELAYYSNTCDNPVS
jgi:hypothetical protein